MSTALRLEKNIRFRTWNLLLDDQAQYSQGSNFGAAGMEGMGATNTQANLPNLQSTSTSLQPDLLPNQSILTGRISRITNTALIELDAHLGAHDTATLEASYGLLHFNSSLLTDTNQLSVVGGYNRKMTARDSIAIESAFTRFQLFRSRCYHLHGICFCTLCQAYLWAQQPGTRWRAADHAIGCLRVEPAISRLAGTRHPAISDAPRQFECARDAHGYSRIRRAEWSSHYHWPGNGRFHPITILVSIVALRCLPQSATELRPGL